MKNCVCSLYDYVNEKGEVHEFQCVRNGATSPCFVVLLAQDKIDDGKSHKWEICVRGMLWRLKNPLWRRLHKNCFNVSCSRVDENVV